MLVIPGRPSSRALLWWALADSVEQPVFTLMGPGAQSARLTSVRVGTPEDPVIARRVFLVAATGLEPDSAYSLEAAGTGGNTATPSRTFPESLTPGTPFTIAFGSCFSGATDRGIAAVYPPPTHRSVTGNPVRLRVLGGDQVYMDLSPTSGGPLVVSKPNPWRRYLERWTRSAAGANVDRDPGSFPAFLRASPSVALADDHEFWNDYPHSSVWLFWSEDRPGLELGLQMDRAFGVFQASLNCDPGNLPSGPALQQLLSDGARSFDIDLGGVRLFFLDTRTRRSRFDAKSPVFVDRKTLDRLRVWLGDGPGVRALFLSQPLVEKRASRFRRATHTMGDVNLPDYGEDFALLWEAICNSPGDVLIVSGDIHWSRLYQLKRPTSRNEVYELIASPLALIPGNLHDPGELDGRVEWDRPGGRANWVRRYATNEPATYCTVEFRVLEPGEAPSVRTFVTAWGLPAPDGSAARPLEASSFILRGRL